MDLQEHLGTLIYEMGEIHFNAINKEFFDKHINRQEKFSQDQIEIFKDCLNEYVEEKLQVLIEKYSNGVTIHSRYANNKNVPPTIRNRNDHQSTLCQCIVDDLKKLTK